MYSKTFSEGFKYMFYNKFQKVLNIFWKFFTVMVLLCDCDIISHSGGVLLCDSVTSSVTVVVFCCVTSSVTVVVFCCVTV